MEHGTRVNEFYHRENIYFAFMQFVDSVPSAKKKDKQKKQKTKVIKQMNFIFEWSCKKKNNSPTLNIGNTKIKRNM